MYNLTYTVALYGLLLFYLGTHELLAPFKPLLKFALVKAVIFLSYWQGLFIAIATGAGAIPTGAAFTCVLVLRGRHVIQVQGPAGCNGPGSESAWVSKPTLAHAANVPSVLCEVA